MAIWKKQNKEESRSNDRESKVMETRDKVALPDENMEKVAGGIRPPSTNLFTEKINGGK